MSKQAWDAGRVELRVEICASGRIAYDLTVPPGVSRDDVIAVADSVDFEPQIRARIALSQTELRTFYMLASFR